MLAPAAATDRVIRRLPPSELERRHTLLRSYLIDIGAQAAVVLASDDYLGGYVRWLTDRPATTSYHSVAIFHADEPMSLIEHGPAHGHRLVAGDPDFPGTGELFTTTSWRSVSYTHSSEGEIVAAMLRRRGYRRVGIIAAGAMPRAFLDAIEATGVELVDVTDFVDGCKAAKSAVEIREIELAATIQDEIFNVLLEQVKPGMHDFELMAIAQFEGRKRGSEQGLFMVSSQVLGQPTLMALPHHQARRFERGDHITVLIENNGPTGYYTELGRTMVLGKATSQLTESIELAVSAQQNALSRLRPGVSCGDVARAHDEFMDAHRLQRETRLFAHSQGYDMVERPLIRPDETAQIAAGMNIVVHPSFVLAGAFGYVCDNFIVQADGPPKPLHSTAQRIHEV